MRVRTEPAPILPLIFENVKKSYSRLPMHKNEWKWKEICKSAVTARARGAGSRGRYARR